MGRGWTEGHFINTNLFYIKPYHNTLYVYVLGLATDIIYPNVFERDRSCENTVIMTIEKIRHSEFFDK